MKARGPVSGDRVARLLYALLWYAATPVIAAYLLWRSRRQPAYRRGWPQRFFGHYGMRPPARCIWLHAVSVGETRAAAPLITALQALHADATLLVTHMTPTGLQTAETLFGDRVVHAYLAYDYPHAVAAFVRHWRPLVGIVMETEIWPNLMVAAERAGTPMILANARLSPKSLVATRRWPALMRPAARRFDRILAQTDADAKRFAILADTDNVEAGTSSIVTIGNVKFDIEPPDAQRVLAQRFRQWFGERRVFLCASTREGEEERILDAWIARERGEGRSEPDRRVLLVIVPRHPQRFGDVFELARTRGQVVQRRSDEASLAADTQVWLGDSMGELWAYYLAADLAYVGGSVVPLGGQNLIEAAAAGCPILIGRNTFNFAAASDEAVKVGAAWRVTDYDALAAAAWTLAFDDGRRRRMADAGIAFAAAHRGATVKTIAIIEEFLASGGADGSISRS
ncbi:MAG: 3-deoxy-D-manno-octulosonic acid transferase [Burkholderiaceae bacterium]